jgi:large subunit ribosomal protein L17
LPNLVQAAANSRSSDREGGYTRILKLGPRKSESAEIVFLELV